MLAPNRNPLNQPPVLFHLSRFPSRRVARHISCTMGFEIRQVLPNELAQLPELEMRAGQIFRTVGMDDIADGPPMSVTELESLRECGNVWVAVHASANLIAGFAATKPLEKTLYLKELSVDEPFQGQGLGSMLVEHAVQFAREKGYEGVTLSTCGKNVPWNQPFYAKRGFVVIEERDMTDAQKAVMAEEWGRGLKEQNRCFMVKKIQ